MYLLMQYHHPLSSPLPTVQLFLLSVVLLRRYYQQPKGLWTLILLTVPVERMVVLGVLGSEERRLDHARS